MSTQCFRGIKEKHKNKKLVYMTQEKYMGVIEGNVHIDKIIPYDEKVIKQYSIVYNPHGQKILPGGFNNLDVTLYSMYPYFCKVKPEMPFISPVNPNELQIGTVNENEPYIVVNTGGQSEYRRYTHMDMVIKGLDLKVYQLGCNDDPKCEGAIDLRDKLSWRESAWVMMNAKAAVCVDSFCAHLAGAVHTPSVVLFGPAPARVTKPCYLNNDALICMESNKLDVCPIMSNCFGQAGKKVCTSPCINTISPFKVRESLNLLMEKFK
jgi:ADP-heptose:LPS heptosyltransferase